MTRYTKTPLKQVILRLDFDQIKLDSLSSVTELIKEHFPNYSFSGKNWNLFNFETDSTWTPSTKIEKVFTPEHTYFDSTIKNSLKISDRSIILDYSSYVDHDNLFIHTNLIKTILSSLNINLISRLWLRYINEIENLWTNNYINNELLWNSRFSESTWLKFSRIMTNSVFRLDDHTLEFNNWFWNFSFPAVLTEYNYILDYDCVSIYPINSNEQDIMFEVKKYHDTVINFFEKSITDEYRTFLNS